jgi:hypothetical protein
MPTETEEQKQERGPLAAPSCSAWSLTPPVEGGLWWVKHGHGRPEVASIGDPSGMCSTDPEKITVKTAFSGELTLALYLGVHKSAGIPIWWAKATPPQGWETLMPDNSDHKQK